MTEPRKLPLPKTWQENGQTVLATQVPEDQRGIPIEEQPIRRLDGIAVVADPDTGILERDARVPYHTSPTPVGPRTVAERARQLVFGPNRTELVLNSFGVPTEFRGPDPSTAPRRVDVPDEDPNEDLLRILRAVRVGEITEDDAVEFANRRVDDTDLDEFLMRLQEMRRQ